MPCSLPTAHRRACSVLRPLPTVKRASFAQANQPFASHDETRSLRARAYAHSQPSESDAKDTQNPVVHVREQSKEDVIRTFFDAFNRRDVHRMAESVADDCEHCNLAYPSPFRGKHAVVDFYRDFMKIVPHDASFEIEDTTGSSESSNVGVIWHLQLHGTVVPNSTGVSFFRLDASNRICYVRESPEHFAKIADLAIPSLSVLSPLVELAQPLLRRAGQPSEAPVYSSQAAPGHNPSYSDSSVPLSHFSAGPQTRAPAVFPDPMALVAQAGAAATHHLTNWTSPETPPPPRLQPTPSPSSPAPPAPPAQHSPSSSRLAQVPIAEARRQVAAASAPEPRAHPFASIFRGTPPTAVAMRPLERGATPPPTSAQPAPTPTPQDAAARDPAADVHAFNQLSGVWKKERALSELDGYGRCLDLMGVGGLQKATALGIEGMEVKADADGGSFEVFYLTPVPFYKVKEGFRLDRDTESGRRDLRAGKQTGRARRDGDRAVVDVAWGEPYGGRGHEEYWLDEAGRLCAQSTVWVGDASATTLQVYFRQDAAATDSRYYAAQQKIPFGVDANRLSESMLGNLLK